MAQALEPRSGGSGTVFFEVERLEQTAAGRLELTGRWFGVRGRRFVRPTLTFESDGHPYRLLADLEHKPWFAEDGSPWTAVFHWDADRGPLDELELTVATDIAIPLGRLDGGDGRPQRRRHPQPDAYAASLRRELQAIRQELADERRTNERLRTELEPLREEVEALRAELERARDEKVENDATLARRDAALARLSEAESERDEARRSLEEAMAESAELSRTQRQAQVERDRALAAVEQMRADRDVDEHARDRALSERESALQARDHALAERDHALAARDQLVHAGDSVEAQRAAARALASRTNLTWSRSPWRAPSWTHRGLAIALLIAVAIVLLVVVRV